MDREDHSTVVLFRRWEPLDNLTDGLPRLTGLAGAEGCNSVVRGSCEIREMHKFKHALLLNKRFDRDGKMVPLFTPSKGSLGGARFSQNKVRVGVPPHAGRWLQLMASDKRQRRAPRLDNDSGSTSQTRSSSRMSSDDHSRDRSASPRPQPYRQCRSSSPPSMSMSRRRAIAKLKDECSIITYIGTIWTLPLGLEWSTPFYQDSILLFPDSRTLTRLRYWAACDPNISNMRQLLELAISQNMKFIMAMRLTDLKTFKPRVTPKLSELTKHTYETGFQEEHLRHINGGAAFCDQYMGKLANILRRPQARALISMGGPTAWIAK